MEFVTPSAVPYVLRPGIEATLTHTALLRSTEALPASISAVTVQMYEGVTAVGSAITASLDGAGPAYTATLPAATTTGKTPSSEWSAVWTYTIDGIDYTFRRMVRLVRVMVHPTVTSTELSTEYPDLVASLRTSAAALRTDLAEAWEDLDRDLWERGVDLHRVFDPRALARLHMVRAAHLRYAKAASSTRDELMMDRAGELDGEYEGLLKRSALYDADSDGAADTMQRAVQDGNWAYVQRRHG